MKTKAFLIAIVGTLPLAGANAQFCESQPRGLFSVHRGGAQLSFGIGRVFEPRHSVHHDDHRYGGSHGYHLDHRRHSSHSCGNDRIKLIGGCQRGKPNRPTGWHDKSWFRKRGYNLDNYVHVHEKSGIVHYGRNVSRSSHSSHDSHRDYGSHGGHSSHGSHGSHRGHSSHRDHGSHGGHSSHRDHGSHGGHSSHRDYGSHGGHGSHRDYESHGGHSSHSRYDDRDRYGSNSRYDPHERHVSNTRNDRRDHHGH